VLELGGKDPLIVLDDANVSMPRAALCGRVRQRGSNVARRSNVADVHEERRRAFHCEVVTETKNACARARATDQSVDIDR